MIIGIHIDKNPQKNSHATKCMEYFHSRGIEIQQLNLLAPDALIQANNCDGVVWRWEHNPDHKQSAQKILFAIEHCLGIPTFPNSATAWHYDEKIYQYYVLQSLDAPVPRTWLFWTYEEAIDWLKNATFPIVFKLSCGAGSSNVLKIDSEAAAKSIIDRQFKQGIFPYTMNEYQDSLIPHSKKNLRELLTRPYYAIRYLLSGNLPKKQAKFWKPELNYAYFQEFLPDNLFDTRITVIGDRAFGFRRFNRKNDFRASGSGIIDYDQTKIDMRTIDIAFAISKKGKFQSMAYDFLFSGDIPVICEISYTFTDTAVYNCPGHWNAKKEWISGNMWPEYAQMEFFIDRLSRSKKEIMT